MPSALEQGTKGLTSHSPSPNKKVTTAGKQTIRQHRNWVCVLREGTLPVLQKDDEKDEEAVAKLPVKNPERAELWSAEGAEC